MERAALESRIKALEEQSGAFNELKAQVKDLQKQVTNLKDIESIKKLQKAYGYYVEHMMFDEIVDCFADSPEVVLNWLEGQWLGKDGVKRYFAFTEKCSPKFSTPGHADCWHCGY